MSSPIETFFPRTGEMYHGHPGTDFQCRCSMVMWDPFIDGKYEVSGTDYEKYLEQEKQTKEEAKNKEIYLEKKLNRALEKEITLTFILIPRY